MLRSINCRNLLIIATLNVAAVGVFSCANAQVPKDLPLVSFKGDVELEKGVQDIFREFKNIEVIDVYLAKSGYACKRDASEAARTMDCRIRGIEIRVARGPLGNAVFVPVMANRRVSYQLNGDDLKVWVVTSAMPEGG